MKKVVILLLLLLILPGNVLGGVCDNLSRDECSKKIEELENQVSELSDQAKTLSSQINYMNSQINLTSAKIQNTENSIKQTELEIEDLSGKISQLNKSLDYLSKILLYKIAESYKSRSVSIFDIFLSSEDAASLLKNIKYIQAAQDNDHFVAVKVERTKLSYEEKKLLREEKKEELEQLNKTLGQQKVELNNQKASKQTLLAQTNNDEKKYQELLTQARIQLQSFKSFVQTSGASSIIGANSLGIGSDGNYYSQRDERWANKTMGYSQDTVLNVGCLITSTAMVAKKYGDGSTPGDLASDVTRFYSNTAYVVKPWKGVAGKSYHSISDIDAELNNGNYVVVGVGKCTYGGSHFVVITKKDGDDYIIHDPVYGPDIKFSDHYSNICSKATFK